MSLADWNDACFRHAVKVKYLDASAIVKLFLYEEEGSVAFRNYFNGHTNFCTTLMTFYEAMNVLKARLFNTKRQMQYFQAVDALAIHGWDKAPKIEVEHIDLNKLEVFQEVSALATQERLDVADAIQIYAILKGKYRHLALGSASVLITADKGLERAAKANRIRVWNCATSEKPDWLSGVRQPAP